MSKGAAELVVESYRRSFFDASRATTHGVSLASARAGNVIGGGDWAANRIVPDIVRALAKDVPVVIRNPSSVRPWQHVLEPLGGYLLLGARLQSADPSVRAQASTAWNVGPELESARPVRDLVDGLVAGFGQGSWVDGHDPKAPHEAHLLRLNIEKAYALLGWSPRWDFAATLAHTVAWYRAQRNQASVEAMRTLSLAQIAAYAMV
jgi:CDP-glucose 4,6-dehydratase